MMSEDIHSEESGLSGIVIYQSPDGRSALSVRLEEGELTGDSVCKDYLHTAADGKRYQTRHDSIDL